MAERKGQKSGTGRSKEGGRMGSGPHTLAVVLPAALAVQEIARGIFGFDSVAWLCAGQTTLAARIGYIVLGVSAAFCSLHALHAGVSQRRREPGGEKD